MTNIIDSLREDHANLAKLLDALERQLGLFDEGETPDYDIVRGVVDYCLDYPDLYHHPKEDLVLEHLKAADPVAAAAIGDLAAEHQALAALTRRFADAIDAILQDIQVPRGPFADTARRFLEAYREHMNKEEREFLPAARRALGAADWAEIDARLSQPEDPLFGAPTEAHFAALRQDVLYWAQEARAQEAR
ncbi:MAG: hemerythrin domain-containing protein [Proteobacteria bacterium]|nr:hemerythrin domain-containing protein [Pseudomonadota bacterium]